MCISPRPRLIIEEMGYQNKSYCPLLGEEQKRYEKLLYLFFFVPERVYFLSAVLCTKCFWYDKVLHVLATSVIAH